MSGKWAVNTSMFKATVSNKWAMKGITGNYTTGRRKHKIYNKGPKVAVVRAITSVFSLSWILIITIKVIFPHMHVYIQCTSSQQRGLPYLLAYKSRGVFEGSEETFFMDPPISRP